VEKEEEMNRISVIAATLLSTLMLFGCGTMGMGDSERAAADQAQKDTASAKASAAAAKQSADAARASEMATRQLAQQTGATPPPPSRTAADQSFRQDQRK
jgi:hypothetical protein